MPIIVRRPPPRRRRGRGRGRSSTGFFGPLPYHSRRTRGGGRVTVSGCCLPIPLAVTVAGGLAAHRVVRRG